MASCITPTRRTPEGWTACGVCTSGLTGHHSAATRPGCGSPATTNTSRDHGPQHPRWLKPEPLARVSDPCGDPWPCEKTPTDPTVLDPFAPEVRYSIQPPL